MAAYGMTDEKKAILIQEIALRPLIWKVIFRLIRYFLNKYLI